MCPIRSKKFRDALEPLAMAIGFGFLSKNWNGLANGRQKTRRIAIAPLLTVTKPRMGKILMKRTMYGLIVLALANLLLCGCATQSITQPKAFTDWPAGTSPAEVGKKAATSMLPRWFAARPG